MFHPTLSDTAPRATPVALAGDTLASVFEAQCQAHADKQGFAFLTDATTVAQQSTHGQLREDVHRIAAWLARSTHVGDRVLLAFPPGLDFVRVFWACLVSGRVAVPVPALDPVRLQRGAPRLRSVIADSRAALVLTTAPMLDAAAAALDPATFAMVSWLALPDAAEFDAAPASFKPPHIGPNTLAYLQYTSGSTSTPRGVRLSHANVLANARGLIAAGEGGEHSRTLSWLPHFHDYGLVFGVLAPVIAGATSFLMSPLTFLRRPLRWLEAIGAQRITHTGAPESAFVACLEALGDKPSPIRLDGVQCMSCGAEPIRASTVDRVLSVFGELGMRPQSFMPCYGLAEAVLGVTSLTYGDVSRIVWADSIALLDNRFEPAPAYARETRRLVGCGSPMQGAEVLVVDTAGAAALPDAQVGEIWVRSPSVGGGYWMQPELSEEIFGAYLADGTGPYLRTGDLGFVDGGQLFVTGRLKDLVIIHGENHYPQDLEWTAERAHADLRPGHSAAFPVDTPAGEAVVLALELERRADNLDTQAIFRAVRRAIALEHALPLHAVAFVRSGSLPRTSSGKVQRHLCRSAFMANELSLVALIADTEDPEPRGEPMEDPATDEARDEPDGRESREGRLSYVMPRDDAEQAIWNIWGDVLGTRAFGVHESFFELGGSSLRMTQVLSRVNAHFGVELPLAGLFEHASVAALAAEVARHLRGAPAALSTALPPGIERVARGAALPASLSQRRMWVIQQFNPASTAYNVPFSMRLRGAFDMDLCQQAFDSMVKRHEGLRTCLVMGDNEPMQWIEPALQVPIEYIDLRHLPAAHRAEHARMLLAERASRPFDLSVAPLHRPTVLQLDDREHVLFWLIHHAITDNWAGALLMREALAAYGALAAGRMPVSTPPAIEYADYAAWQRRPDSVEARRPHLAYWVDHLRGLPDLDLPTDFPRPVKASFKGARVSAALPQRLRDTLRDFGSREAVTPFVVFLSAFTLMLSRMAKNEDILVGTPIANRHRFAAEQLVGTLVNTLVMRTDLSGNPDFTQLVHRVRRNALEAFAHQEAPYDELIDALGHDRTLRPEGPVRVLFNVLNAPVGKLDYFGLEVDEFDFERTAAQFDLSLHIDTEFSHRIHLEYATDLYAPATAARMLENYLALTERLLAQPERRLAEFEMISPAQMSLLRHGWNGTGAPLPEQLLVHRFIRIDAPEVRDRIAVVDALDRESSFGDLDAQSNRLAHALRQRGIARGNRVGLCIERSPSMLIAQLAVMKAGAAYVPLDPEYPIDRLRYMAADANLSAVLTQDHVRSIVDGLDLPVLLLDDDALTAGMPDSALEPQPGLDATPADDAYVIYTSGSTGQPKGVRVPHRGVVNFVASMVKKPGLGPDDCVVAITSPSFDPSVLDLMLPLTVRARLVIASHAQMQDPVALRALLERHQATFLQATPSAWRMLIAAGWTGTPRFRALIGGEALPPALAEQLMSRTGELWNIYGPTETTVWSTAWKVESPRRGISVGLPVDNATVWALDEHGHVCPIGVPGELYIGGAGVARGYYHRDTLTEERFLPDPFSGDAGGRLYRTGDLGRWRHDGLLEHLGRVDHQVKLRGYRIELGEIESALLDHPAVASCVAVTRTENEEDDVRLVAYCVAREGIAPSPAALREHLRARMPQYMIPQHFVLLDRLPQLPNGKVNRGALPAPVAETVLCDGRNYIAPATHGEQVIAGVWSELLGVERISRTDNFFDLGGHSLLAMRAVTAVEALLGRKIPPRRLIYESLQQVAQQAAS